MPDNRNRPNSNLQNPYQKADNALQEAKDLIDIGCFEDDLNARNFMNNIKVPGVILSSSDRNYINKLLSELDHYFISRDQMLQLINFAESQSLISTYEDLSIIIRRINAKITAIQNKIFGLYHRNSKTSPTKVNTNQPIQID